MRVFKKKSGNDNKDLIGEFRKRIKKYESEFRSLEKDLKMLENRMHEMLGKLEQSKEKDISFRKNIEELLKKMQGKH